MTIPIRLTPAETLTPDEAEFQAWKRSKQLPSTGDDLEFEAWKRTHTPAVTSDATAALARNRPNATGDFQSTIAHPMSQAGFVSRQIAAHILNAAQAIPGMEAGEAYMGHLGSQFTDNPLTYEQSLNTLRGEVNQDIPPAMQTTEKLAASIPFGAALPVVGATRLGTVARATGIGAGLGAADRVLQADPNVGIGQRATQGAIGGLIGGGVGLAAAGIPLAFEKGRELSKLAGRVREAPTGGATELAAKQNMADLDARNYGLAEAQGAAHQTSPGLQQALDDPRIKPYADMVRTSEDFQGADDATVARETYKLMSEERTGFAERTERQGRTASMVIEDRNLAAAQRRLKAATAEPENPVMEAFPQAVAEHADAMSQRRLYQEGYDDAGRMMGARAVKGRQLATKKPEAVMDKIQHMNTDDAEQYLSGWLSRGKEAMPRIPMPNPNETVFGAASHALAGPGMKLNRLSPFVNALDVQAGRTVTPQLDPAAWLKYLASGNALAANP